MFEISECVAWLISGDFVLYAAFALAVLVFFGLGIMLHLDLRRGEKRTEELEDWRQQLELEERLRREVQR